MKKNNIRHAVIFQIVVVVMMLLLGTLKTEAQLKVGSNPKILAPNVLLEIESSSGKAAVITKDSAFLGIGTLMPTRRLEIQNGNNPGAIKIVDGTQGAGKVLTSDANGVGIWTTPSSISLTPKNLINSNGIIIDGGTGSTLNDVSLRIDSQAIAKFVTLTPVKDSVIQVLKSSTTNVISNPLNTISSNVNGVISSTPVINSISNSFNTSTRELITTVNGVSTTSVIISGSSGGGIDSTTASNGLTMIGKEVKLGGVLNEATKITQSNAKDSLTIETGGNKFKITGLLSGSSSDSILTLDVNNVVRKIQISTINTQPIRVVTSSTTLTLNDYTIVLNSTSAATFTLPAANTAKDKTFRIVNNSYYSGNDITLSIPVKYGTGTSTSVDDMYVGGGFYTSSTVSTILIQSDGTSWWFIGR